MQLVSRRRPELAAGATRKTPTASVARAVGMSDAEWHILISLRPNLLLEGNQSVTHRLLRVLEPLLVKPLVCWRGTPHVSLRHDHRGSLLLLDVATMDAEQQARVFDWLSQAHGHVQVVSTSAQPLFALVEREVFRADLYYRLNALRFDILSTH